MLFNIKYLGVIGLTGGYHKPLNPNAFAPVLSYWQASGSSRRSAAGLLRILNQR